ncbi:MAG: glycosyltransferase family 4 protein [Gaiellaceae bacterium]
MRVALATQFFPPETFAGANRVAAMAQALAEESSLQIAAPAPGYPDPAVYAGQPLQPAFHGAPLRRISAFTAQRRSWPMRAGAESLMAAKLARVAAQSRPDVIVASSPSMFLGPACRAAARARGAKFVWDLRDLTWEYGREGDVIAGRVALKAMRALAKVMWATAERADIVVCANDGLAEIVRDRVRKPPVEVVRNGVDESLLELLDPSPAADNGSTSVLYAGLLGHAQELDVLVDVAALAPDLRIVLAGDGPCRDDLEDVVRRRGLDNVVFTGYVTPHELARLYHESDVLFAQVRASELHAVTAVPSKLLEYMAAGRPIVYAGEGAAVALVEATGAGITTAPGDAGAIVDAIRVAATPDGVQKGARGRTYVSELPSRADEMRRFARLVSELAATG